MELEQLHPGQPHGLAGVLQGLFNHRQGHLSAPAGQGAKQRQAVHTRITQVTEECVTGGRLMGHGQRHEQLRLGTVPLNQRQARL